MIWFALAISYIVVYFVGFICGRVLEEESMICQNCDEVYSESESDAYSPDMFCSEDCEVIYEEEHSLEDCFEEE